MHLRKIKIFRYTAALTLFCVICYIYFKEPGPEKRTEQILQNLKYELKDFNYESLRNRSSSITGLSDLTPDTGGIPIVNLLISTFRSGSTFMGHILNSFPGSYYHYESLVNFGLARIRDEMERINARNQVQKLLHCDFKDLDNFIEDAINAKYTLSYNIRTYQGVSYLRKYTNVSDYLSNICKFFPIQTMKLTRLLLNDSEAILQDRDLNVKIIFLIRDPRGVLSSRWRMKNSGIVEGKDWENPAPICDDMVEDYHAAKQLLYDYPSRIMIWRYEDFALNVYNSTEQLYQFLGMAVHTEVKRYLDSYTNANELPFTPFWSTYRNTKETTFKWVQKVSFEQVDFIQRICKKAMKLWGYKPARNQQEFNDNFYPIYKFNYDTLRP